MTVEEEAIAIQIIEVIKDWTEEEYGDMFDVSHYVADKANIRLSGQIGTVPLDYSKMDININIHLTDISPDGQYDLTLEIKFNEMLYIYEIPAMLEALEDIEEGIAPASKIDDIQINVIDALRDSELITSTTKFKFGKLGKKGALELTEKSEIHLTSPIDGSQNGALQEDDIDEIIYLLNENLSPLIEFSLTSDFKPIVNLVRNIA